MALNQRLVKVGLGIIAFCIAGYILGPPLYWHIVEGLDTVGHSSSDSTCAPCVCDCSPDPMLSIPEDCAKHDPDVSRDTENNFTELLSEEVRLRGSEALESQQRGDMALLEAKKVTSQYQKEADKCTSGMTTCEEAREKAEAALAAQKKLTAMWEHRARLKGWKEGMAKSRIQTQGSVQSA